MKNRCYYTSNAEIENWEYAELSCSEADASRRPYSQVIIRFLFLELRVVIASSIHFSGNEAGIKMCAHFWRRLSLCLTRDQEMKRCQRDRCNLSWIHTLPTVAVINNTAITPPRPSERISLSGGGLWAFGALRHGQLACVWMKPWGVSLLKVTWGADLAELLLCVMGQSQGI